MTESAGMGICDGGDSVMAGVCVCVCVCVYACINK